MPAAMAERLVGGVRDLVAKHGKRGFLLDQFGVLHDGETPYPGAVEAVKYLHEQGAAAVLVSNSSQRAESVWKRLGPMGFDKKWFAGVVTSGELAHEAFAKRGEGTGPLAGCAADATRVVHFTWAERGKIKLDGLGLTCVQSAPDADVVLASGVDALGSAEGDPTPRSLDELKQLAAECAARDLPIVIANPDYVTVAGAQAGKPLAEMPGAFMKVYEACGKAERIVCCGKPGHFMFERGVALLQAHNPSLTDLSEIVMVGDSLHHDIAGAHAHGGIASVFVMGGIHAEAIAAHGGGVDGAERLVEEEWDAIKQRAPTFVMERFR